MKKQYNTIRKQISVKIQLTQNQVEEESVKTEIIWKFLIHTA